MPARSTRTSHRVRPRPDRAAATVLAAVLLVACSSGDDDASVTTATAVTSAVPTSAAATTVPSTGATTAPGPGVTTAPATSDLASTTATSTATSAPTTVPATVPATTDPAGPATTEALAVQELVLTGEGLGAAVLGADPDGVIEYVTSILGSNTDDTGWVPPDTFAVCEGTVARRVDWGALSLLFSDLSPIADERRHFIGYEYGRVGQIDDEPVGLRTPGGLTRGSRVIDLLAEFPEAAVNEGEPDSGFPDNFYVNNLFYGLLTGTTAEDYVTVLFGGYGCFE